MNDDQIRKTNLLSERFVSRDDVYAIQWKSDDGRSGWTPKVKNKCKEGCKAALCEHKDFYPITSQVIFDHLNGDESVGVYQLDQNSKVKWLCFDLDYNKGTQPNREELIEVTKLIRGELQKHGVPSLVEDSTNKGIHIWVFLATPLPAHVLFALGRWIMQGIELPTHMHVEVFPKQTQNSDRLGNLVRLPLGFHKKTGKRTQFLDPKTYDQVPLERQWRLLEDCPSVTRDQLKALFEEHEIESQIYQPKQQGDTVRREKSQRCLVNLLEDGAGEGLRDAATFRLACMLRDYEMPILLAKATLEEWNATKNSPPLSEEEILVPLESAYSNYYSAYPCSDYQFDSVCVSDCYWYENKMKFRRKKR